MGNFLSGMTFLKNYSVTFDFSKYLVHFPDLSQQHKQFNGDYFQDVRITYKWLRNLWCPRSNKFFPMSTNEDMSTSLATVEATTSVTRKAFLLVRAAIVKLENNNTIIRITNPNDKTYTSSSLAALLKFTVLTPYQDENDKSTQLKQLSLIRQLLEKAPQVIDQLFREPTCSDKKGWYPTTKT